MKRRLPKGEETLPDDSTEQVVANTLEDKTFSKTLRDIMELPISI